MPAIDSFRLCACLLNISEARQASVVEKIARAAILVNRENSNSSPHLPIKSSVLNIFSDLDYNRSVITIVSPAEYICRSVSSACKEAFRLIDLKSHKGGHPRLGAVDLVPIHPLSSQLTIKECGLIAREIAEEITSSTPGSSAFLFGGADLPNQRGLVMRRKEVNWYNGCYGSSFKGVECDIGAPPSARYGLTGIGAIPYVMNCNVTIETTNIQLGKEIATAIRSTSPSGFQGVQSMAFSHEGNVEIACNVEAIESSNDEKELSHAFGSFYYTSAQQIESRVSQMASEHGVSTRPNATIIGFSPSEAQNVAYNALISGQEEFWTINRQKMM